MSSVHTILNISLSLSHTVEFTHLCDNRID